MSAFTGPLSITELDRDWKLWRLNEPLVYEVGSLGSGRVIACPAGMITDGASVPQPFWSLLPVWGSYSRAAAVHDRLCYLLEQGTPHPEALTYQAAASIFDEAMAVCGTPLAERETMTAAVRAFYLIPKAIRPKDINPYPCGSVQALGVVLAAIEARKAS
jgi:hypothetical protein